jgi:hypothetical protein
MKYAEVKLIILVLVAAGLIWLVVSRHLLEIIFAFVFIGLIPGTNVSIPASAMLLAYAAVGYAGIWWFIKKRQPLAAPVVAANTKKHSSVSKKSKTTARKPKTAKTSRKRKSA